MKWPAYRLFGMTLLLALASHLGTLRPVRADDTGALIGGIIAGALVYELLDDDDYCGPRYYQYYYRAPGYYCRPPVWRTWGYECYTYGPPVIEYRYYEVVPRGQWYYDGPPYSYRARRAPSHAERDVGPPPKYRGAGKYAPPRYYK